ncbi:MAG TPA: hypothetical protein VFF52_03850 [Isosphaeraceae bacterium]|nr:hypothetical protein [Isosphaeraceae bacterium]
MAVSLNSAKGALNSFTGTDLFKQAMYHDKAHFDEAQAKQSITDGKRTTCGVYYKKAKKTVWVNNEDSSLVKTSLKKGQKKSKWHQVKTDVRQKVDVNSGFEIINAALEKSGKDFVKFKDLQDGSKFLFAVPLKETDFGGVAYTANSQSDCSYIALIVDAGNGANATLRSHYPVETDYVDNKTDLT